MLGAFAVLAVFANCSPSYAMTSKEEKDSSKETETSPLHQQPKFEVINEPQLLQLADQGDEKAQKELIERNYWGFLNKQFQNSLWSLADRGTPRFKILSWKDVETRAIEDDRIAYALINAYDQFNRWSFQKLSFDQKFPRLFQSIKERAEVGDLNACFNLGVIYLRGLTSIFVPSDNSRNHRALAVLWMKKAALGGHSLAVSSMGLLSHQGYATEGGRNDVEALRWYLPSSKNKLSRDGLCELLSCSRDTSKREETFHQEVQKIKEQLQTLWGRHAMHVQVHNPNNGFIESKYVIPQLGKLYQKVVEVEVESLDLLTRLQETTPGFMMTRVQLKESRDRKKMLDQQTNPPFVSVDVIDTVEYLTLGDKNVPIVFQLLAFVGKIEEKFGEADKVLKRIGKLYQMQIDQALSKLMTRRIFAIPSDDETSVQRFMEQQKHLEELENLLKPHIEEISEERKLLAKIKEDFKGLIPHKAGSRNRDFREEHPFLN